MVSTTMNAVRETINEFLQQHGENPPPEMIRIAKVPTKEEASTAKNFISMSLIRTDEELTSFGHSKQEQRKELLANGMVRMYRQTGEQQNQMWGMLGSNARPAVLYQMRTSLIDEGTYVDLPRVKDVDIQFPKPDDAFAY